jgi:hypothetical protein
VVPLAAEQSEQQMTAECKGIIPKARQSVTAAAKTAAAATIGGRKQEEGQRHDATACSGSISNEADVVAMHDTSTCMTVIT